MRKQNKEIQLTSYDDLLGIEEERTDKVMEASLSELYPFKEHPFQVRDDEKMEETVDSIKNYGVLIPGLVRPRAGGGYELIAGHRRKAVYEAYIYAYAIRLSMSGQEYYESE